jgi:hypothetical protein
MTNLILQQMIMAHVMQVDQFIHLQVDNMYDKYDKFNLILKNLMAENSNTWGNAGADRVQRFF